MKILLTGHRGFIGSRMLVELERRDHCVDTYDWGDLMPSVSRYDWVIHLGAISSTTERDINKILSQNFDFTRQLYDACRLYNVNLQYASSAGVYGMGKDFRECATPDPRTPYAWSKYLCERYHSQHPGTNCVQGFRYFNVYGPDGEDHKGDQASPFYKFREQSKLGRIQLFRGSDQYRRDFIQVDKLIEIQLKFLLINQSGIWNIGSGSTMSFREVAELYNCSIEEIDMPENLCAGYQTYTCADMTKTKNTLTLHDAI